MALLIGGVLAFAARAQAADDVTPPSPPVGLFVQQGGDWKSENAFDLWWVTPGGQETPIAAAHYEICPLMPSGPCVPHEEAATDIDELSVTVPYPGWFLVRVWLEDSAGNVNPSQKSPSVALKFDDERPGLTQVLTGQDWLSAATADDVALIVEMNTWAFVPLSDIRGYSLTTDGTEPDNTTETLAAQDFLRFTSDYMISDPPGGITTVKARAVSNAGVASDEVGTGMLKVDRTSPAVAAMGAPGAGQWSRQAVSVELKGSDQDHLSGMGAADSDEPADTGGHLVYRLDGAPAELVRGDATAVAITEDGHHTLAFKAVDAAGNPSVEKSLEMGVDRTAPAGVFELQDPADPRRIVAAAHDSTSGVANGWIEFRREGESAYRRLATTIQDGRLVARLDDEGLSDGRYDFRARVLDHAGNEGIIDRVRGGQPMVLGLPVRLGARVLVEGQPPTKPACVARKKGMKKAARRRKRRAKAKRCSSKPPAPVAGKPIRLGHGKRLRSTGRVVTAQGAPIPGAKVSVETQLRTGGAFVRLKELVADGSGTFRYVIPAGASRTVRFRFDGSSTVRPAAGEILTEVKAAVRLKPSRKRLVNGQTVIFRGRLLGKPIPRRGKVVSLQAKVGRTWRTFATPRANARGVFKHRYRFTATTGLRRYKFRAVAGQEDAYPYETGVSKVVKVVVRGR